MIDISTTEGAGHILSQSEIDALEHEKLCKLRCCANCEYWELYGHSDDLNDIAISNGECHRYPPQTPNVFNTNRRGDNEEPNITDLGVALTHGTPLMAHTFSYAGDWCGEFSALPELRFKDGLSM